MRRFKRYLNKKGYSDVFNFIIGRKSPSLWAWRDIKR